MGPKTKKKILYIFFIVFMPTDQVKYGTEMYGNIAFMLELITKEQSG